MTSSDEYAGCGWPVDETCLPTLPEETSDDDGTYASAVAALDAAKALAIQVLWALSGRQYGVCPTIVRPCPQRHEYGLLNAMTYEVWAWYDRGWHVDACGCGYGCVQSGPSMVHLPGPAQEVLEVTIDGLILDPTEYILEGDVLYRTGAAWWPRQDLSLPAGEEGTWTVEYLRGIEPPAGTGKLVALLATEFYNACTGGKCRLPRSVSEVSRQGVSYRTVNPNDIYGTGKTGVPEIDLWLSAVNPYHLITPPEVL